MITGIIFVCLIEQDICQPMFKRFDTVQECIVGATDAIESFGDTPGVALYYICDPDSQPA